MDPFERVRPVRHPEQAGSGESFPQELVPVREFLAYEIERAEQYLKDMSLPSADAAAREQDEIEAAGYEFDPDVSREVVIDEMGNMIRKIHALQEIQEKFIAGDYGAIVPYLKDEVREHDIVIEALARDRARPTERFQLDRDRHQRMLDIIAKYLAS